jgi:hypothetical protein
MSALFLLPGFISLYFIMRGRIATAFVSVYLPCLLLLPNGYQFRLPHLPSVSAAQAALIPIGVVALYRLAKRGLPSLMDILMVLFMISTTISEVLREHVMNDGIFYSMTTFVAVFLAYATGRTIIEPDLRFVTVRRFVILVLVLGPVGLIEWRLGINIFGMIAERIFNIGGVQSGVQIRSGHGRISTAFNDAELAGIVFGMTAALNVWLFYLYKWRVGADLGRRLSQLEKYHIPGLLCLAYLFFTQSRGPMLAVGAAYLILQVPRFRNKRTAMILVGVLLVVGGIAAYSYFKAYTNIDPTAVANEQQGSALYRRQMNEFYQPIVQMGGPLGWGMLSHPILPGMFSIDNEFLLVHLAYGDCGYYIFLLITAEAMRASIVLSWKMRGPVDQAFAISLLGAMAVFFISVTTAYMGEQTPQIAFLLMGWIQSVRATNSIGVATSAETIVPKFAFRRVLQ